MAAALAKEGDIVDAGAVVARMDTAELEAHLQAPEAQVRWARQEEAEAIIVQRDSELTFAAQNLQRTSSFNAKGWASTESLTRCGTG
jgi:HlyD family secretion protein